MGKLEPEHSRAVAGLIRGYGKVLCELTAAKALLRYLGQNQKFLVEWEQALEEMKAKPGYRNPAQALEIIALQLERNADDIDLSELLKKLPEGSPIN